VEELQRRNLWILLQEAIKERQIPLLGICLGMQLLFEESEEYGSYSGLGILRGKVKRFLPGVKIPHLGWNQLEIIRSTPLLSGIPEGCYMYFVHSFYVGPEEDIVCANTDYGMKFASVVQKGNIFATQFHPEKSQKWGLRILKNFSDFVRDSQEKKAEW
jgi:glutamine amidotransferase